MKKYFVLILAVVLLMSPFSVSFAEGKSTASSGIKVEAVEAQILSSWGIEGNPIVLIEKEDTIFLDAASMDLPGAYVELQVKLKNSGRKNAYLSEVRFENCDLDYITVQTPMLELEKREVILPGKECTFTTIISWDKNSTYMPEMEDASFSLKLLYVNDEVDDNEGSDRIPEKGKNHNSESSSDPAVVTGAVTGDASPVEMLLLLLLSSVLGFLWIGHRKIKG